MESWNDLATDSYSAAERLFQEGRWRSAINRAYYAAYSLMADALIRHGLTMPTGREGPTHKGLPNMVLHNANWLREEKRWILFRHIGPLYQLRLIADYKPSITIDCSAAKKAIGLMALLFKKI